MPPRPQSRHSHASSNCDSCQYSRTTSRKKYLQVISKPNPQPINHLKQSAISLPTHHHLQSTNTDHTPSRVRSCVGSSIIIQRSSSQPHVMEPVQRVIVRETIQSIPVSFKYINPKEVNLNQRHSLPTKKDIIMSTPTKNIPAFTLIHANYAPHNHQLQPKTKHFLTSQPQYHQQHDIMPFSHSQQFKFTPPPQANRPSMIQMPHRNQLIQKNKENTHLQTMGKPAESVEITNFSKQSRSIDNNKYTLNNSRYLNEEINLGSCIPSNRSKTEFNVDVQNYNSLQVVKGDTEKNLKQNLDIQSSRCICDKILNFSKSSQIQVNPRQALKPKKNFVFV